MTDRIEIHIILQESNFLFNRATPVWTDNNFDLESGIEGILDILYIIFLDWIFVVAQSDLHSIIAILPEALVVSNAPNTDRARRQVNTAAGLQEEAK